MAALSKNFNQSAGAIQSIEADDYGIDFQLENGRARIDWYSESVYRVRVSLGNDLRQSAGYAVTAKPGKLGFKVKKGRKEIEVISKSVRLKINRAQFAISAFNADGKLLNQDDPKFAYSWIGNECCVYKSLQKDEAFLGLGEKAGGPNLKGSAWTNWNTDAFMYGPGTDPLYATFPVYLGYHSGLYYGIFFDNSHKTKFNFGASSDRFAFFKAEDGDLDYYFFAGEGPADIIKSYSQLTGLMPMPPRWSMGYQQCRYSYYPDDKILELADGFRRREIPADVLYCDIHYMDRYRVFSWDPERFSNPKAMSRKLQKQGFRLVTIVDPGVPKTSDPGYKYFDDATNKDLFVKYPDGEQWIASVWPGPCAFPDFTKAEARKWWADQIADFTKKAELGGIWNDMNEPATWGQDTPDLIEFDMEGEGGTHKEARNVYGMQMVRATREGLEKLKPNERPFVLTRAAYAGVQRYAAVWTGDNTASDENMLLGVRMLLSLGLTGVAFSGYDIGGFVGEASPQLFARWMSIATFAPFYRGHTMINTRDSEPWSFGEHTEEISKNYIKLRYRLMPYIYSIFKEASDTGMPIARTPLIHWPQESKFLQGDYINQYMFGPNLMVCACSSQDKQADVYLPESDWYYLYDGKKYASGQHFVEAPVDRLPVFVPAGGIVVMQSLVQHTDEAHDGVLRIHLYQGGKESSFDLFDDDGISWDFQKGKFASRKLVHKSSRRTLVIEEQEGKGKLSYQKAQVFLHGYNKPRNVKVNGKSAKVSVDDFRFLEQLSDFDPWGFELDERKELRNVPNFQFNLIRGKMEIKF
jgi:alpha-glucosidase